MSWWGTHPVLSKDEARKLLIPGACKECVYYTRCNFKSQWHPPVHNGCNRCNSIKSVRTAPFNKYQSDLSKILGAIQQGGRYLWSTDLPVDLALQGLIHRKIVTFSGMNGQLAEYRPLVKEFLGYKLK